MKMRESNGTLDIKILDSIEEFWGFGLPNDYKKFLLSYNGGIPENASFNFKGSEDGSAIDSFYGFVRGSDNILNVARDVGDRYPSTMLPIADDVYGNRILITVKGSDRGKIYFWDHEMESYEGEEPDHSNLTLIANSFDEFFNSLHELGDSNLEKN